MADGREAINESVAFWAGNGGAGHHEPSHRGRSARDGLSGPVGIRLGRGLGRARPVFRSRGARCPGGIDQPWLGLQALSPVHTGTGAARTVAARAGPGHDGAPSGDAGGRSRDGPRVPGTPARGRGVGAWRPWSCGPPATPDHQRGPRGVARRGGSTAGRLDHLPGCATGRRRRGIPPLQPGGRGQCAGACLVRHGPGPLVERQDLLDLSPPSSSRSRTRRRTGKG